MYRIWQLLKLLIIRAFGIVFRAFRVVMRIWLERENGMDLERGPGQATMGEFL